MHDIQQCVTIDKIMEKVEYPAILSNMEMKKRVKRGKSIYGGNFTRPILHGA